jgi:simple sugar transport system permease protein
MPKARRAGPGDISRPGLDLDLGVSRAAKDVSMSVTTQAEPPVPPAAGADERAFSQRRLTRVFRRPELGAALAALAIFLLFALNPTSGPIWMSQAGLIGWLSEAWQFGILAVPVGLLMIGGEFDLSCGVMTGATGIMMGLLANGLGWNIWLCIAAALVFSVLIGLFNGLLVTKTKLPSFIVTLATFFILRGVSVGLTELLNSNSTIVTVLGHPGGMASAKAVFSGTVGSNPAYPVAILWWVVITVVGTWMLQRTTFGNWIFASGGDANAARNVGVPVNRTKILLFIGTAVSACLVGAIQFTQGYSAVAEEGAGYELFYIVAAVVGGCLLTGGYGSVIGATLGAAIIGMALQGVIYAGWPSQWGYTFLGFLLLLGVVVNTFIYRRAQRARR